VSCARPGAVLCQLCQPVDPPLQVDLATLTVHAAAPYEEALRAALIAYKERGRRDVASALAQLLAGAIRSSLEETAQPVALVAVPSTREAARARGGDHMLRLARLAARLVERPVARNALSVHRAVADSAGLTIDERQANLDGAMRAGPPPPNITALIVDDIVTTGSTLLECGRALRAAGWVVSGAAVIAATPRYFPEGHAEIPGAHLAGSARRV
jgi:predicted amidophosphoribosyltransferase